MLGQRWILFTLIVCIGGYMYIYLFGLKYQQFMQVRLNRGLDNIVIDKEPPVLNQDYPTTATDADDKELPLLTIFTTVKDRQCRESIHTRTINNWAALRPYVDPILYVPTQEWNTSKWSELAAKSGWIVRETRALRNKVPILVPMFKESLKKSRTPFVAYANADIIFDTRLVKTLRKINKEYDVNTTSILIVGRRMNANISVYNLGSGSDLDRLSAIRRELQLFHGMAQDYFIISRKGLPWMKIPDFVVGRNGYDNWLVVKGQEWNITLIDASLSITAIHQVGIDGIKSGSTTNKDGSKAMNLKLVPNFNYGRGRTECAPYYTQPGCSKDVSVTYADKRLKCDDVDTLKVVQRPWVPVKLNNMLFIGAKC